ncbi:MAG TPA: HPr family phosphocarrier protein [Lachnospiraceae bacterium]|nr:HPr family phosphocarrier protein [Lachnospiraceae bacterium]
MQKLKIRFQKADDVFQFVKALRQFDFDIDLSSGHQVVDAKSIVSAVALSGASDLMLTIHNDDCGSVIESISPYITA